MEVLVHNLEHGYTVVWYDSTVTGAQLTAAGVPARVIGVATGDRLIAKSAFDVALADATHAWRDALPALMNPDA